MKVPFLELNYDLKLNEKIKASFADVIESGYFIHGPKLQQFEDQFSRYCDSRFSLGVSNGLDALVLSLKALGIGHGDKVIVPAHTFIATWLSISEVGAQIVPVDIDLDTAQIDLQQVANKIEADPKIRCVMPVHLYGNIGNMDQLIELCKSKKIYLIEDSAQAHGTMFKNKKAGSFGDVAAFSFYPGKNLGAFGDAGAITTSNHKIYEKIKLLRNYGSQKKYYYEIKGSNHRLDEVQAAILITKMDHLDEWNQKRSDQVQAYQNGLKSLGDRVQFLKTLPETSIAWHLCVVRLAQRDLLMQFLKEKNVETLIHYPVPCYACEAYKDLNFKASDFPKSQQFSDTCVSLPIGPHLNDDQIQYSIEQIQQFFKNHT